MLLTYYRHFSLGGSGVPPGTRPETCWHCRGSGMVRLFSCKLVPSGCRPHVHTVEVSGELLSAEYSCLQVKPGTQPGQKVVLQGKGNSKPAYAHQI
ncbi:hypothetical protein BHM03_00038473 [Ensete ventricosum]|nr:hypothetical protein BHM03_00038473 [Ensete ventricosum]